MSFMINILYAEDDIDDVDFFKEALDAINLETRLEHVSNGQELLAKLLNPDQLPDIVFIDINMPLKNGYESVSELRAKPWTKDLPAMIFSTSSSPEVIEEMYKIGASSYIVKPDDFSDWQHVIYKALIRVIEKRPVNRNDFVIL